MANPVENLDLFKQMFGTLSFDVLILLDIAPCKSPVLKSNKRNKKKFECRRQVNNAAPENTAMLMFRTRLETEMHISKYG